MPQNTVSLAPMQARKLYNTDFLAAIFRSDAHRALTVSFPGDPFTVDWTAWHAQPGRRWGILQQAQNNNYFCVSTFAGDRRKLTNFERCYAIVLDDVGDPGKVRWSPDHIRSLLTPAWEFETSPGSFQFGYALWDPNGIGYGDPRGGKVSAVWKALADAGFTDPGAADIARLVKLPEGVNGKPKAGGWVTRVQGYNPFRQVTLAGLVQAFQLDPAVLTGAPDDLAVAGKAGGFAVAAPGQDWRLDALVDMGVVLGQGSSADKWDVECPFAGGHTVRALSGTAYLGGGNVKCMHGSCAGRSNEDYWAEWDRAHPGVLERHRRAWLDRVFGDIGGSRDPWEGERDRLAKVSEARAARFVVSERFREAFWAPDARVGPGMVVWLLKKVIPAQSLGVVYGPPKSGKSFFLMDLLCRLASGKDWNGNAVKRRGIVALVSSEGGRASALARVSAWRRENPGVVPSDLIVWPGRFRLGEHAEGATELQQLLDWLTYLKAETGEPIVAVAFDTLNRNMVGDENSSEDMTAFVNVLVEIKNSHDCAVLVVHHSGKDESKGMRGSSVLLGAVDWVIEISRGLLPDGRKAMTGRAALTEGRDVQEQVWGYELKEHTLALDEDLEPITSLSATECPAPAAPANAGARRGRPLRGSLGPRQQEVLDAAMEVTGGADTHHDMDILVRDCNTRLPHIRVDNVRRALTELKDRGLIRIENDETDTHQLPQPQLDEET